MSRLDSNDAFVHLWYIWRFVGIYPYAKLTWLYNTYAIVVNLAASLISPISVFANIFFLKDMGSIMNNLQASLTLIVSSIKQFVIFLRISDLQRAKTYLNKLDRRTIANEEEVRYLKAVIKQCRLIVIIIQTAFVLSLASFSIPGLIKRRLVFEGWFPFDWSFSVTLYLIAFMFQLFATCFQIIQNAANDAFPPMYINLLMGQIHVLCMRVKRIGTDPGATVEENYMELKSCINDHQNIIGLFKTIRPIIGQTIMIQFLITAFVLCITVVHFLIFNREIGQLISTIIYLLGIVTETFPVYYFGNALITETEALTIAIYSCNWTEQSMDFRKCMIIFMQRSQLTNIIKAGGLVTITLQTFIAIIRFSFSMFTILSQLK